MTYIIPEKTRIMKILIIFKNGFLGQNVPNSKMEMTSYKNSPYKNISFFVKKITTHPEKAKTVKSRHGLCSFSLSVFRHGVKQAENRYVYLPMA